MIVLMCDKLLILISSFHSVQSAFGAQCSDPWFCEIWMAVELEGGCFCNSIQVRKKTVQFSYTTILKLTTDYMVLLCNRFIGFLDFHKKFFMTQHWNASFFYVAL